MQNKDDKAANMIVINSQNSVECAENLISTAIIKSAESKQGGSSGVGILERVGANQPVHRGRHRGASKLRTMTF